MTETRGLTATFKRWEGNHDLPLPAYATAGAAGFDFRAAVPEGETVTIEPNARALIPTGFAVALPIGYEMQIRPRSGLAAKNGVSIVNAPGTVDSGYRGEIKVCLLNTDPRHTIALRRGDLIAQLVVQRVAQARFVEVQRLPSSERGDAGHGSTGGIDAWRSATDTMKEQA